MLACFASFLWALDATLASSGVYTPLQVKISLEWFRYVTWFYFLLSYLNFSQNSDGNVSAPEAGTNRPTGIPLLWVCVATGSFLALIIPTLGSQSMLLESLVFQFVLPETIQFSTLILLTIIGLGIIEQLIRSSTTEQRWAIKFICLGVGAVFVYDFFMYSESLLFKSINPNIWQIRGIANALIIPLIAVSAARHTSLNLGIHVSRQVVFQSATVIGAGIYLLTMSAMGYYIRYLGGNWGSLFQVLFLFTGGLLLASLIFSDKFRKNIKVLLNKHFYSYKYDYREQWLEFTHNLANSTNPVPVRCCEAMAQLVAASGAMLWCRTQHNYYEMVCHWHIPEPSVSAEQMQKDLASLIGFLGQTQWVVDFDEKASRPDLYGDLELPHWLTTMPKAWLIVPLIMQNGILGFILLKKSEISQPVNWEDRDLLKMAGQQAAIHLTQHLAEEALIEARQFEAYNRLSTYVMHDLKNILAQQSLIISNAEKHKGNPEFVDDVIRTISNSVDRMNRLLRQMKRGSRSEIHSPVLLVPLLEEVIFDTAVRLPQPTLNIRECEPSHDESTVPIVSVLADPQQLKNVFTHLIQNAQEATDDKGSIQITLGTSNDQARIEVVDNGHGMDSKFIKERLFKAFDTTKGLMGMGIGAFESRQYIHSIGGSIEVKSSPGRGSTFTISLPLHTSATPTTELFPVDMPSEQLKSMQSEPHVETSTLRNT